MQSKNVRTANRQCGVDPMPRTSARNKLHGLRDASSVAPGKMHSVRRLEPQGQPSLTAPLYEGSLLPFGQKS
jgi:hypothetical protein